MYKEKFLLAKKNIPTIFRWRNDERRIYLLLYNLLLCRIIQIVNLNKWYAHITVI